jgi:GNAT superfamily N-acetyltransferase
MPKVLIRPARAADAEPLTELAVRSEGHWGYSPEFMRSYREAYGLTGAFIARHAVFVAELEGVPVGFYALVPEDDGISLEYLYIEPARLGTGLGRMLWEHMVAHCRQARIPEISLVCGPQPLAFYLKMGAAQVGEVDSLVVPGRKVPKLRFQIV